MCHSRSHGACVGCCHGVSRRGFVKGCGAALLSGGLLGSPASAAEWGPGKPVRVGLVYLSKEHPAWPYPEFDIQRREREILGQLKEGCRGVVAALPDGDVQRSVLEVVARVGVRTRLKEEPGRFAG